LKRFHGSTARGILAERLSHPPNEPMRLPPPSPAWYLRPLHQWQRRRYGTVLQPTALWSYRPRALLAFQRLFRALRRRDVALPLAIRTLVSVRVSQLTSCAFCVDMNTWLAHDAGVDENKALALPDWRHASVFSPGERLALEYAEAMTCTPPTVNDALFARLQAAFAPEAIVELTAVISFQNMSARFNAALGAEAYGFCTVPAAAGHNG
jgi:AhpD family alkylhydroperoxidase